MTTRDRHDDEGFTLVELLVVIIVIGILSAIAIPTFLRQREKGYRSQALSDMKNAALAVETYASQDPLNSYAGVDGANQDDPLLQGEGFKSTEWVTLEVVADDTSYCIEGVNEFLPGRTFIYRSNSGRVQVGASGFDSCG